MIRFLKLKDQIDEGKSHFAYFGTINNSLISFGYDDQQVFESWPEFIEAFNEKNKGFELERFSTLVPLDYIEDNNFTKGTSIFKS